MNVVKKEKTVGKRNVVMKLLFVLAASWQRAAIIYLGSWESPKLNLIEIALRQNSECSHRRIGSQTCQSCPLMG